MNTPRFIRLQIYRGWAIVCVVGFHTFARWTPPLNPENLYPWNIFENTPNPFSFGYLGVNLFFMISGFVITQSLENSRNLLDFWTRRILRIWPSLTVIVLAIYVFGKIYELKPNSGVDNSVQALFSSLTIIDPRVIQPIFHSFESTYWITGVLWSLWVEISFYLIASLLFHKIRLKNTTKEFYFYLCIAGLTLIDLIYPEFFKNHETLDAITILRHYIFWFYIGVLSFRKTSGQSINMFCLAIAFCVNLVFETSRPKVIGVANHLIVVGIVVTFHLFFRPKNLKTDENNIFDSMLARIGDVSYEIYLIHEFTLLAMISWPALHEYENYSLWVLIPYLATIYLLSSRIRVKISDPINKRMRARFNQFK